MPGLRNPRNRSESLTLRGKQQGVKSSHRHADNITGCPSNSFVAPLRIISNIISSGFLVWMYLGPWQLNDVRFDGPSRSRVISAAMRIETGTRRSCVHVSRPISSWGADPSLYCQTFVESQPNFPGDAGGRQPRISSTSSNLGDLSVKVAKISHRVLLDMCGASWSS